MDRDWSIGLLPIVSLERRQGGAVQGFLLESQALCSHLKEKKGCGSLPMATTLRDVEREKTVLLQYFEWESLNLAHMYRLNPNAIGQDTCGRRPPTLQETNYQTQTHRQTDKQSNAAGSWACFLFG